MPPLEIEPKINFHPLYFICPTEYHTYERGAFMKKTIGLLAACMIFLTACGKSAGGNITFTVSHTYDYYRAAVEQYNKTAAVPVEMINFDLVVSNTVQRTEDSAVLSVSPSEPEGESVWTDLPMENYLKAVNTGLMSGDGFDIIDMSGVEYYKYAGRDMLVNFDDLIANDPSFAIGDYDKKILDMYRSEKGLFVMPISHSHICWAIDNALLEKLNIVIDDDTWTWNDMLSIEEKMAQAREAGLTGKYPFINTAGFIPSASLFSQADGMFSYFIDEETKTARFNTGEFIELLELFGTLGGGRYVHPSTEIGRGDYYSTITDGFFAFCYLHDYDMRVFKDRFQEYRLLKKPSIAEDYEKPAYLSGRIYAISKDSPHIEEAWEFIKLLLSKGMQDTIGRIGANTYHGFPVRLDSKWGLAAYMEELNRKDEIWNSYKSKIERSDIDYIDSYIAGLNAATHSDYNLGTIVRTEADKYFSGKKSARDAARTIQDKVEVYLGE